jgi:hypothetical protein
MSTAVSMATHLSLSTIALVIKFSVKIYSAIIRHEMENLERKSENSLIKTFKVHTQNPSMIPSFIVVSLFTICLLLVPFTDRNLRLLWVAPCMVTIFTILIPFCIMMSNPKMENYFKFQILSSLGKFYNKQITPIV